jgi:hypothetical protein
VHSESGDPYVSGAIRSRPRRWVAERTLSWFGQSRLLIKEYAQYSQTSDAMIYPTMTRIMFERLAHFCPFSDRF